MNIGIRVNSATGQFMRAGLQGNGVGKQMMGFSSAVKNAAGETSQTGNMAMRMRMAEMNAAQSTLPQAKREVVFDAASGTTFDAQRMSRSAASVQKKMKKLQYNFKLISSQIMRAKTSSSASQAVSSAKRVTAQLRRKRKSGEYDDEELEAAITHALAMERVAKKHVKYLQQEERAERGSKTDVEELPEDGQKTTDGEDRKITAGDEVFADEELQMSGEGQLKGQADELPEAFEEIRQELAESLEEIPEELTEEMEQLMQEYGDMMNETMEQLDEEFLDTASDMDTDMTAEDIKELKRKHRVKEMQEIAKADAKYLKVIFEKYASDRQQAASGVSQVMGTTNGMSGMGGVISVSGMPQTASASAPATASVVAPAEGGNVDISV